MIIIDSGEMIEDAEMRAEHLEQLKKGDFIWVSSLCPLFKTYSRNNDEYLGCDDGDSTEYDDRVFVLKGVSPTVYKPTKMAFVAKIANGERKDDVAYVFTDDIDSFDRGDFRFGQHIIMPHRHFKGYHDQTFYLDELDLSHGAIVRMEDVFFTKEDCLKRCRKLNTAYWSVRELKCIKKTLNSLKKQFNEFTKSDLFVDAKKQIENDLAGKKDPLDI